ncbi:hypothetical protein ACHAWX_006218 [Stephanocyclus meneghinianus]
MCACLPAEMSHRKNPVSTVVCADRFMCLHPTPTKKTNASARSICKMEQDNSVRTIKLISKEGEIFKVPFEVVKLSNLVVTTLGEEEHDDDNDDDHDDDAVEIPLPNVKASVLAKVVEFCTHYKDEPS